MPVGSRIPLDPASLRRPRETVRFATLEGTTYARLGRDHGVQAHGGRAHHGRGPDLGPPRHPDVRRERRRRPTAEERLLEFAELVAAAVASAENKAQLRASRARLVATADETRRRLQRDVHDGAQQRLVQTVLTLKLGLDLAARGEDPVELVREALAARRAGDGGAARPRARDPARLAQPGRAARRASSP